MVRSPLNIQVGPYPIERLRKSEVALLYGLSLLKIRCKLKNSYVYSLWRASQKEVVPSYENLRTKFQAKNRKMEEVEVELAEDVIG